MNCKVCAPARRVQQWRARKSRPEHAQRPDDIEIGDLGAAGLRQPCVIRVARIATFEWGDQIRRVGALHRRERQSVTTLLQRWFGL
jgi:hypothetical protein